MGLWVGFATSSITQEAHYPADPTNPGTTSQVVTSNGQVEVIRKSSAEALIGLEDASLDFVYIDGNHLYDYVKQDLELSFQKVKAGGLITGDDYGPGGWWDGGVQIAVDEFCANYPVTTVWIRGSQFILRKTAE